MCNCVAIRDGCFFAMAALWTAYWMPGILVDAWACPILLLVFAFGCFRLRIGAKQALIDGDSANGPETAFVFGACVFGLYYGFGFGMPGVVFRGLYVSLMAACFGNLMLMSTARLRRERIERLAAMPAVLELADVPVQQPILVSSESNEDLLEVVVRETVAARARR